MSNYYAKEIAAVCLTTVLQVKKKHLARFYMAGAALKPL